MSGKLLRLPQFNEPVWLDATHYQTRWKGRLVTVDITKLRPVRFSDELIRECSVNAEQFVKRKL